MPAWPTWEGARGWRALIEQLIAAGALDTWGIARRQLLWDLGTLRYAEAELDLPIPTGAVELSAQSRAETFAGEIAALGLSPSEHVMTFYRGWLDAQAIDFIRIRLEDSP